MDASTLCRRYGLGASHRAAPIHPGTVAQVWQASTPSGEVVIRTLTDRAQGEREFLIWCRLLQSRFYARSQPPTARPADVATAVIWFVQEHTPTFATW